MTGDDILRARARLAFDAGELRYDFGPEHPLQSRRLSALIDLLESGGLWRGADPRFSLPLRPATVEELALVHTPEYISLVQRLSAPRPDEEAIRAGYRYGLGSDIPLLPELHERAALIAGGTLVALSAVMGLPEGGAFATEDERPLHVFHPAGGLHNAWAGRASGYCVYNDAAVAIAHVLRASDAKVLYVDFDAHHGDGIQRTFYDEPRVMTISFHESPRTLFPGSGEVLEMGAGLGRGYCVNVPLEAHTDDDSFEEALNALLPPLALSFGPDVIVSQHGCDGHVWDPLVHLDLTLKSFRMQARLVHELAHRYCGGRWLALGGGGYDLFRVVPRAWSAVWAEMTEQALPERLPQAWVARWQPAWQAEEERTRAGQLALGIIPPYTVFPLTFDDRSEEIAPALSESPQSTALNRQTVALVRHLLVPVPVRQAFLPPRRKPYADMFDLLRLGGSKTPSRSRPLRSGNETLLLRDFCPPSFVERLRPDAGLQAFTRYPEREYELLLQIARSPDCALTLAYTTAGVIVGEVTLSPAEEWWEGLDNVYDVTIEVSTTRRGGGLAKSLLAFALERTALEDLILLAMGLSWHWDMEGLGLSLGSYRRLIARLFASQGFQEYRTREPDISADPGNVLMVRIGKNVAPDVAQRFLSRL